MSDPQSTAAAAALAVDDLKLFFQLGRNVAVRAVDGVSFQVAPGRTLGVVGESGSGKSTVARLLLGLYKPDAGTIRVNGKQLGKDCSLKELRRAIQMVFQDSYSSLNPRMKILDTLVHAGRAQGLTRGEAAAKARMLLPKVGLAAERYESAYPSELSGGQRQRVNIARALVGSPQIVVLDEAVSALDKSVEAQVLNLLLDLREEMNLTYIFISHDLNVVRYISDDVLVMYLGEVIEVVPAERLFEPQTHPYTRVMVASMPSMDPNSRTQSAPVTGDPPSPLNPPSGCRFHTRCGHCADVCRTVAPRLRPVDAEQTHLVACHLFDAASGHPGAREVSQ